MLLEMFVIKGAVGIFVSDYPENVIFIHLCIVMTQFSLPCTSAVFIQPAYWELDAQASYSESHVTAEAAKSEFATGITVPHTLCRINHSI